MDRSRFGGWRPSSVSNKVEIEDMLWEVGWYPVYHWPRECLEFVKDVRLEVRRMGFCGGVILCEDQARLEGWSDGD